MNREDKATLYFESGFNCSQSVFTAIAEKHGLDPGTARKIASGFGGGIARMQMTCGAVTGGVMAIGYLKGHEQAEETEKKDETYRLIRKFVEEFTGKHHSIECSDLLGFDMNTEEGKAKIKELQLTEKVCLRCVKDAVNLVEGLLADGRE